jgi:uncharacterized protein (TIGR02118 family)
MIRLAYLLRRKTGTSRADFQKYWRENHGPLVASHARTLNVLRYVQVHTILEEDQNEQLPGARGKMEKPYDGVAELWWTSREEAASAHGSSRGQAAAQELLQDEAKFIDLPSSPLWFGYEYPQVNPSPENMVATEFSSLVKFYFPLRHLRSLSLEEAQLYWRTAHGPLIRRIAAAGHIKRYIQVHRYVDELETVLRQARGTVVEPYTGHAELWFERIGTTATTPERTRGGQLAIEDESKFIDFARSSMWYAKEHVFVDYR